MIIIYTHFYADPYGTETEEDMKIMRNESNKEIFSKIMEKIKEVSDVIEYDNLIIKYFNSFTEPKNDIQKIKNNENRNDLQKTLNNLSESEPLFHQVEIKHIKNHKWEEEGKKYFGEVEIIGFFDLNNEPIKERINIIHKEEVKETINIPPPTYSYHVYNAGYSSSGNLCYNHYSGNTSNSHYAKKGHSAGGGVLGTLAGLGIAFAASGVGAPLAIGGAIGLGIGALFGSFF